MACVYILRSGDENLFKIGRTTGDLDARIKQLSTGNPHPLTPFDVIETEHDALCETYLHHNLRSKRSLRSDAREFFSVEPAELESAIREGREFLAEFVPKQEEAHNLAREHSDGRVVTPDQGHWQTYHRLVKVREAQDALELERRRLETDLKLAIGTASELDGLATWKTHMSPRFDEAEFRAAEPALYAAFLREKPIRTFRLRWGRSEEDMAD